jgi:hypothetical protein
MPVDAIRSIADQLNTILRYVNPRRVLVETEAADKALYFRYFKGYRPEKVGRGRIRKVVEKEVLGEGEGNAFFANLLIVHWNEAKNALYQDIVAHVRAINEDVEAIEQIEDDAAKDIIDDLLKRYPREEVLISVRLNGVRFGEEVIAARLGGAEEPAEGG